MRWREVQTVVKTCFYNQEAKWNLQISAWVGLVLQTVEEQPKVEQGSL